MQQEGTRSRREQAGGFRWSCSPCSDPYEDLAAAQPAAAPWAEFSSWDQKMPPQPPCPPLTFFAPRPPEEVKNKFLSKTNPEKALSGSEAQRCQVMGREGKIPMGSRAQLGWGLCSIRTKAGSYCFPQHPHAM